MDERPPWTSDRVHLPLFRHQMKHAPKRGSNNAFTVMRNAPTNILTASHVGHPPQPENPGFLVHSVSIGVNFPLLRPYIRALCSHRCAISRFFPCPALVSVNERSCMEVHLGGRTHSAGRLPDHLQTVVSGVCTKSCGMGAWERWFVFLGVASKVGIHEARRGACVQPCLGLLQPFQIQSHYQSPGDLKEQVHLSASAKQIRTSMRGYPLGIRSQPNLTQLALLPSSKNAKVYPIQMPKPCILYQPARHA
jgi:hypothetical protein